MMRQERVDLPLRFTRKAGEGYRLPAQWKAGNCGLQLNLISEDDVETASFREIAIEAGKIMLTCVALPPHYGGTNWVGLNQVMNVSVFGVGVQTPPGVVVRVDELNSGVREGAVAIA